VTGSASGGGIPVGRPRRGRPRNEEADRAILRAATEALAARGLRGLSIDEVAARAGVGKATIYRRWPSKGTLALDAFLAENSEQLPLVAETQRDPELAASWRDRVVNPIRASYASIFARAVQRGEIAAETDTDIVLDLLFGAGLYRLLHRHRPLDQDFVGQAVALVTAALGVPAG